MLRCCLVGCLFLATLCTRWAPSSSVRAADGQLVLRVVDRETGQPLAARLHLFNQRGKPVRVPKLPFWHDHVSFVGEVVLRLPKGAYTFELEHGPEYLYRTGHFQIDPFADDAQTVDLGRAMDMAAAGWWSGDLNVLRPPGELPTLLQAEDLHLVPLVTTTPRASAWSKTAVPDAPLAEVAPGLFVHSFGAQVQRASGTLSLLNLDAPLDWKSVTDDFPTTLELLMQARQSQNAWFDAARPTSPDLPVWLATRKLHSLCVLPPELTRGGTVRDPQGWYPDDARFSGHAGPALWAQEVYFQTLNAGLRLPPSAGSGSGVAENPVGYNRVYVHVPPEEFSYSAWWENFRAGRVVVTNGPLIQPQANGELPGYEFTAPAGETVELEIAMNLGTRDTISYVELIQNGQVAVTLPFEEWAQNGRLPPARFEHSGWCLVRVVTDEPDAYHVALSAPWYVTIGAQPFVRQSGVEFFRTWLDERRAALQLPDDPRAQMIVQQFDKAEQFWDEQLLRATFD